MCPGLFFDKGAGLRPVTLLKRRVWHRCFSIDFAKFLRKQFLQNNSGKLVLTITFNGFLVCSCIARGKVKANFFKKITQYQM